MSHMSSRRAASLALALSALPLVLVPAAAATATGPSTKAAIEHAEQQAAAPTHPAKAQVENDESTSTRSAGQQITPSPRPSDGLEAAAWQLALSAALGALLTGGVVVGYHHLGHQGTAIAS